MPYISADEWVGHQAQLAEALDTNTKMIGCLWEQTAIAQLYKARNGPLSMFTAEGIIEQANRVRPETLNAVLYSLRERGLEDVVRRVAEGYEVRRLASSPGQPTP